MAPGNVDWSIGINLIQCFSGASRQSRGARRRPDRSLEPILRKAEELTDYASAFRYPDAPYEPGAAEAAEALTIAVNLCTEVQRRIESAQKP